MSDAHLTTVEYRDWLKDIEQRLRQAQLKAAVQVNTALLTFYWELGADINGTGKSNLFEALIEIFRHIVEFDRFAEDEVPLDRCSELVERSCPQPWRLVPGCANAAQRCNFLRISYCHFHPSETTSYRCQARPAHGLCDTLEQHIETANDGAV